MAHGQTTRDRLVRAASELFWRQGFAATGVGEILERARATTGSFYHFFGSKEDLLGAVLEHARDQAVEEMALAAGAGPGRRLDGVIDFYRRNLMEHDFAHASPLAGLAAEVSWSHPEAGAKIARLLEASAAHLDSQLVGQPSPAGSSGRRRLARFALAVLEGAFIQARVLRSLEPFDAAAELLRDFVANRLSWNAPVAADRQPDPVSSAESPPDWKSW